MSYLLYGCGFLVLLVAAMRVTAYRRVRAIRLRGARYDLTAADEVPAGLRHELEEAVSALLPLGFQARGFARVITADADDARPQWSALAEQAQQGTWALIAANPMPEPEFMLHTCLFTPLADGRVLMSAEGLGHLLLAPFPESILVDHGELDPLTGARRHAEELARLHPGSPFADATALLARLQTMADGYLPMLKGQGLVTPTAVDGSVRPTAQAAWSFAGRIQRGQAAQQRALVKLRQRRRARSEPVPAAIEAEAVLRVDNLNERRTSGGASPLIFVVSLLAFIVASRFSMGSGVSLTLIVAILLFHEFGHYLAMRTCGYRDTAIFFLPLFGAAATGRKSDATIPQQVLVSLMGPLPGIIVGLVVLAGAPHDRHDPFCQAGLMLVVINLFNLLPILPLDGGQIVNRLLFGRRPWLDFSFRVVAVAALLALGVFMTPVFLYLGCFLGLALITQFQIARLRSRITRDPTITSLAGDELKSAISALVVQDPAAGRQTFANRLNIVREVSTALSRPAISLAMSLGLLAAYVGSCLLAPVTVFLYLVMRRLSEQGSGLL